MVGKTSLEKSFSGRDCPNQQVYQLNRAKNALVIIIIIIIIVIVIVIVIVIFIVIIIIIIITIIITASSLLRV